MESLPQLYLASQWCPSIWVQLGQQLIDASVGDSLTCTAIAVDFEGTLLNLCWFYTNTTPVVSAVVLNNLSPYTNDVLSVSLTFDFNGDNVTLSYEWHVMDASTMDKIQLFKWSRSAFSSLDGSQMMGFDRDDEVYVNVTPNDGTDNGTTVESDHAVVLNTTRGDNYCKVHQIRNRDG